MKKAYIAGGVLALGLLLYTCAGSSSLDPKTWDCDNLRGPIMKMSKGRDPEVFEITDPRQSWKTPEAISCYGSAEMSNGETFIAYEAHVTDGGQVVIGYKDHGPGY